MLLSRLVKYARVPLELNGRAGEEVLILTDTATEPAIARALAQAAAALHLEPSVLIITPRLLHGHEPSRAAAEAMKGADLILCATSTAMSHTAAIRAALAQGKKYVSMPGITTDMLTRGAATADYQKLGQVTAQVAQILTKGKEVRLTSPQGTEATLSIKGRPCFPLAGVFHPGAIACFPDGEAAMAAVEGSAQGTIVFDLSVHTIGRLEAPIRLTVEKGKVMRIEGGPQAQELLRLLQQRGDANSFCIGEFAVGTNPKARVTGNVSEDKKKSGTVHIGLGDNCTLAGQTRSATHLDGIISCPTLWVDGKLLIREGKLLV